MKEKIIKQLVELLGDGTGGKMDYRIWYFRGEWWIICDPIGSAEPVKDWLEKEIKIEENKLDKIDKRGGWICPRCGKVHSWLSMTCDCPPNVITASTTEPKEVTEIKGENNCNNCIWGKCLTADWPCFDCDGSNKWKPIKTE